MSDREVIVAADFPSPEALETFLAKLPGEKPYLKVGMELFYAAGPDMVRQLKRGGYKIFLDLKLHDIPNTVQSAMSVLKDLGVDMVNVHAGGGIEMMAAAVKGLGPNRPKLIAVTQLTSTSQRMLTDELLIDAPLEDAVATYAKNAQAAGLDGVVCSPREVRTIKEICGEHFLTVAPGVRFADSAADDQVRIATPAQAGADGADYIVVGRPITRATDPLAAYQRCVEEFRGETE